MVSYVAFENGKPVGAPKDVVTGLTSPDQKELYGAPVGIAQDREGGLYLKGQAHTTASN